MFVYFVGIKFSWILFSFLSTIIYGVLYTFYPNAWADQRIRQEFKSVIHPVVRVYN